MPRTVFDVTQPISERLPVWPGDPSVHVTRVSDGLPMVSGLHMSCHAGTHVDAPAHFLPGGAGADELPLDVLIGPAWVTQLSGRGPLTAGMFAAAAIPEDVSRLLVRTDNSARAAEWFDPDFVALAPDAGDWLLARGFRLVGIDGPSIEPYAAPDDPVHRALLAARVVVVENLALAGIAPGAYDLICLPLPIAGSDGAPARVVLVCPDD